MAARLELPRWLPGTGFAFVAALVGVIAGIDPRLAIAATLGMAFALVAFSDLAAALVAFVLLTYLETALSGLASLSVTKAAGLLLAVAWLAKVTTARDQRNFFGAYPNATYLLVAFLGWGALSVTWTETTSGTLNDLTRYMLNFSLLAITYTALRTRNQVIAFFAACVIGTALTAVYGFSTPPVDATSVRIESTVGDANSLAAALVAGVVLSLALAVAARPWPMLRLTALGSAVLALFSFVFTGSRGGVLALIGVMVMSVVIAGRRWRAKAAAASVALAVAVVIFFTAFAPAAIQDRITQTVPGQVPAKEGRATIWQVGWRMVEAEPFHGVGMGSFRASGVHYLLQPGALQRSDLVIDTPKVAHNIYLQALAELGVVGLALFLGVLAFPVACAARAARNFTAAGDRQLEILSRGLVVALAGILTADFFVSDQFSNLLWLLLAAGPALLAISAQATRDGSARGEAA